MKKIILSLAALAAVSTTALAERNYDISSPPFGETVMAKKYVYASPFAVSHGGKHWTYDNAAGNGENSGNSGQAR
jgi:hypothetical protein